MACYQQGFGEVGDERSFVVNIMPKFDRSARGVEGHGSRGSLCPCPWASLLVSARRSFLSRSLASMKGAQSHLRLGTAWQPSQQNGIGSQRIPPLPAASSIHLPCRLNPGTLALEECCGRSKRPSNKPKTRLHHITAQDDATDFRHLQGFLCHFAPKNSAKAARYKSMGPLRASMCQ